MSASSANSGNSAGGNSAGGNSAGGNSAGVAPVPPLDHFPRACEYCFFLCHRDEFLARHTTEELKESWTPCMNCRKKFPTFDCYVFHKCQNRPYE